MPGADKEYSNNTQSFLMMESVVANSSQNNHRPATARLERTSGGSSNSTLGTGVIMSEMRNKLIDIQNNKQYIEQKI